MGPMDESLATQDAGSLAAALRAKQVSSRELLDLFVDRIDRLNPKLNAVVTLDVERARDAAAAADEATARGEMVGPAARAADHDQGRHRGRGRALDRRRRPS